MPTPRNNPARSAHGADASGALAREHLRVLRKRLDYIVEEGESRRRRGLRADLEFGEAAALEWGIAVIERTFRMAAGR